MTMRHGLRTFQKSIKTSLCTIMDLLSYFTGQRKKTLVGVVKGTLSVSLMYLLLHLLDGYAV